MRAPKKVVKSAPSTPEKKSKRFWFTAPHKMAESIYDGAEDLGLYPYEYIRILVGKALKGK